MICCSLHNNLACEGGGGRECLATATAKVYLVGADLILPFGVLGVSGKRL